MKINRRIVIGIEELKKKKWKIILPLTYVGIICFVWVMGAEYMIRLDDSAVSDLYKWIFHICAFEAMLTGKLKRIVVACDEFAQVLTKKEKDKEKKELHSKIELQIEKIASLGRAFGIHLQLSTQRPDSDVLDGKIKGNLGYKVCGRADSVLSKIIIDNTNASELISQKDVGFFVTNFNTFFKAYYFDDRCWKEE